MSAFIVDYKVIDEILSARFFKGFQGKYPYINSEFAQVLESDNDSRIFQDLEDLGKEFLTLNIISVNERYDDNEGLEYAEQYTFKSLDCSLAQSIKSLSCLMYQSCEIPDYKNNETYKKMEKLHRILTGAYLYLQPDYDNATWGSSYYR